MSEHPHRHRHLSKKEKRQLLYKKNRAHQRLFHLMRLRRAEDARVKAMDKSNAPKKPQPKSKKNTNDKLSKIRNRLTGKKRMSKERWNRFAGTSGGGGRGL